MERTHTLALQHNFRDLGGFFAKVAQDENYPADLRSKAARYNPSVVRGFLNIAEPLGGPAARLHDKLPFAKKALGGILGAAMGLTMGAVGAAWQGFNWGKTFGGLWAGNRTADALGHLPPHPETEAILRQDYPTVSAA